MALGPFVISLPRLFLLLGLVAAMLTTYSAERGSGVSVRKPLWWSLAIGFLVARIGYVLTHLAAFEVHPWQALYFWRGGFLPALGVLAAVAVAALASAPGTRYPPRRLFTPMLVGLAVWGGLNWVSGALRQGTQYPLPEIVLQELGGEPVSLASFEGAPVVVNLWASWCPPCRREMPILENAQKRWPEVQFVFVNQGEGKPAVRQYLRTEQLELNNVLLDYAGYVRRYFRAPGLPTTLFFNADGELVANHIGALTRASLNDYLQALTVEGKP